MLDRTLPLNPRYSPAVRQALTMQAVCTLLCILMLDGGFLARRCAITLVAFWSGGFLVLVRRPRHPTPTDLALLRWAFPLLFAVAFILSLGRVFLRS